MMPNDMIEICRVEYDRLVDALNQNKLLREELEEVTAERDTVAADRDRISKEFSEVCANYLRAKDELKYLSEEVNFLRGFKSAMEMALNGRM
jgi:hypothetical protein